MIAGVVAALVVIAVTGWLVAMGVRGGHPGWRTGLLALAGVLLAVALALPPGRFGHLDWLGGALVGLTASFVPFALVLADVRGLLRGAGRLSSRSAGPVHGALALLLHPLVGGVANTALLIGLFSSGAYDLARDGGLGWVGFVLLVLLGGLWGCAALLDASLLVLSPGMRIVFAVLVSAMNQLPGVMVINGGHTMVGGGMWLVAAPMVIPLLFVAVHEWMRHDQQRAREIDAQLDAQAAARQPGRAPR